MVNKEKENLISAISSFIEEERLREQLSDSLGLARVWYILGDCNRAAFDPETADRYLDKAYALFEKLKDTPGLAKTLTRMGAVKIDSREPDKLETGYRDVMASESMAESIGDYDLRVNNHVMMGSYFTQKNETGRALEALKKACELLKNANEKYHLSLILTNMAIAERKAGHYAESVRLGNLAYRDALATGLKVYQWLSALALWETYNLIPVEDSMYKYQAKAMQARLTIIDDVRAKQKSLIEMRFITEKYESDLDNRKSKSRLVTTLFIISFLSAVIILTLILIRYIRLNRVNRVLAEQNRVIEDQKEELTQLTSQKDKFYSIIAHDLRSPFNAILGFSEILTEELQDLPDKNLYKMAENMNQSAVKLFHLLENLLEWSQLQERALIPHPEHLPLANLVNESLPNILEMAGRKEIQLNIEIPGSVYVFADRRMLGSIVRNLVWNALKFTPKGGSVRVFAERTSDQMVGISIEDSGIGMSPHIVENLFRFDKSTNRPGTEGEPSSGLGLMICKEFAEHNNGEIRVTSVEGKGSKFTVLLPANPV
jgi:signal transduction histidine kinase